MAIRIGSQFYSPPLQLAKKVTVLRLADAQTQTWRQGLERGLGVVRASNRPVAGSERRRFHLLTKIISRVCEAQRDRSILTSESVKRASEESPTSLLHFESITSDVIWSPVMR